MHKIIHPVRFPGKSKLSKYSAEQWKEFLRVYEQESPEAAEYMFGGHCPVCDCFGIVELYFAGGMFGRTSLYNCGECQGRNDGSTDTFDCMESNNEVESLRERLVREGIL